MGVWAFRAEVQGEVRGCRVLVSFEPLKPVQTKIELLLTQRKGARAHSLCLGFGV